MRSVTAQARNAAEQRQQLYQVAGGALLAGILLWSFLPGTVARAMPESWHWPERMAARMVGASSRWDAGARMMQSDSPEAWNDWYRPLTSSATIATPLTLAGRTRQPRSSRCDAPSKFVRTAREKTATTREGPTTIPKGHTCPSRPHKM
ncbi:MAG: hypothetical protein IPL18_15005 [Sphingomonadales bacterium]|nr:hypothetical protein [Sphingomonadales bacterium]